MRRMMRPGRVLAVAALAVFGLGLAACGGERVAGNGDGQAGEDWWEEREDTPKTGEAGY